MTGTGLAMSRRFRRERLLSISPATYERAIRLLAVAAETRFAPINAVVGIANGGLAPAADVSAALGVPAYQITAKHNPTDAIYTEATGSVTHDLSALAAALDGRQLGGTVLLVDDICGSGATFATVTTALRAHLRPDATVRSLALCRNAGAQLDPDLWGWTVDDWVLFPWETSAPAGATVEPLPLLERAQPA